MFRVFKGFIYVLWTLSTVNIIAFLCFPQLKAEPLRLTFECESPNIKFTLGENSNPSKSDLLKLCNCLDETLSEKSKQINSLIKSKKNVSKKDFSDFLSDYNQSMQICGAFKL